MATASNQAGTGITRLGDGIFNVIVALGDFTIFSAQVLVAAVTRRPSSGTLVFSMYTLGVRSVPVVAITGMFIGMVLAVQSYDQFHHLGLATHLGAIINISVVRELGPVLAAVMLAGRVGSAMAAELATMRITEQVDALTCLGANPVHYLAAPRFLAGILLIPLLTIMANFMGVMGGAFICIEVYHVEAHYYWMHTEGYIGMYDIVAGLIKPMFFGAAIALISCHRGLNSSAGAEGVGRAATEAFVASFIAILALDFLLAMFLTTLYDYLWPAAGAKLP